MRFTRARQAAGRLAAPEASPSLPPKRNFPLTARHPGSWPPPAHPEAHASCSIKPCLGHSPYDDAFDIKRGGVCATVPPRSRVRDNLCGMCDLVVGGRLGSENNAAGLTVRHWQPKVPVAIPWTSRCGLPFPSPGRVLRRAGAPEAPTASDSVLVPSPT